MGSPSVPPQIQSFIDHRTTLIKVAASITGCRSRAEDVVQDAFFRLESAHLPSLSIKAQLSYMFRTVRNLAIDYYRKQAFEQRHRGSEEEGLAIEQQENASPESLHQYQETLELIADALSQLPERTRYAFEMHRIHGQQQREIARELGVSPTLVNFMIRDALVHCRKVVEAGRNA
ncbi:RNA polymerase factor sigma-70 [Azotobacter armeniacus]